MARKDIMLDDSNELIVKNGDFSIDSSDNQHVGIIFQAVKGEIRPNPSIGFGAKRYLKKIFKKSVFLRNLKVELEKDGYVDPEINFDFEKQLLEVDIK